MKNKKISYLIVFILSLLVISACMPGTGANTVDHPAGFFMGIWHGWIAPISLIVGIFNSDVHVYEAFNTGWWYDFGFYIAIIGGFGGLSLARKKNKDKN